MNSNRLLEKFIRLYRDSYSVKLSSNNLSLGGFYYFLNQLSHTEKKQLSSPARIQWEITGNCNLHCKQCYYDAKHAPKSDELTTEECIRVIKQIKKNDALWIELQGGEPLLRQDIVNIIEEIKKENIALHIITNGTLFTDSLANKLSKLLDYKTDMVQISLDGSCPKINDKIRGTGSFKKIIKGIKLCSKYSLKTSVNTTLMNDNIHDLSNIYKLVSDIKGISRYSFFSLMRAGRAKELQFSDLLAGLKEAIKTKEIYNKKGGPTVKGYLGYIQQFEEYPEVFNKIFGSKLNTVNRNTASISSVDIDYNGDIYPSSYLQNKSLLAGNIKTNSLNKLWNSKKWDDLRTSSFLVHGKCTICSRLQYCGGGTRTTSFISTNCFSKSDSQCLFNPTINTKRLSIRPPERKDFEKLKTLWEDKKVMELVGFPNGLHQSNDIIYNWINDWDNGNSLRLIIEDNTTKQFIGEIGYRIEDNFSKMKNKRVAALDIKLLPKFWGRGIGHEAMDAFIKMIMKSNSFDALILSPNIRNKKAILLYKKLGFKFYSKIKHWKNKNGTMDFRYMVYLLR